MSWFQVVFFPIAASLLAGQAPSTEQGVVVTVGEARISVPAPATFRNLTTVSPQVTDVMTKMTPPSNRFLTGFLSASDVASLEAGTSSTFDRYMMVQSFREIEGARVGEADFGKLIETVKLQHESMLAPVKDRVNELLAEFTRDLLDVRLIRARGRLPEQRLQPVGDQSRSGLQHVAELVDFLLLQGLNRHHPGDRGDAHVHAGAGEVVDRGQVPEMRAGGRAHHARNRRQHAVGPARRDAGHGDGRDDAGAGHRGARGAVGDEGLVDLVRDAVEDAEEQSPQLRALPAVAGGR